MVNGRKENPQEQAEKMGAWESIRRSETLLNSALARLVAGEEIIAERWGFHDDGEEDELMARVQKLIGMLWIADEYLHKIILDSSQIVDALQPEPEE